MDFIRRDQRGFNLFQFACPGCGAEGEFGVKQDNFKIVHCPNRCGALFIQSTENAKKFNPTGAARLECVTDGLQFRTAELVKQHFLTLQHNREQAAA